MYKNPTKSNKTQIEVFHWLNVLLNMNHSSSRSNHSRFKSRCVLLLSKHNRSNGNKLNPKTQHIRDKLALRISAETSKLSPQHKAHSKQVLRKTVRCKSLYNKWIKCLFNLLFRRKENNDSRKLFWLNKTLEKGQFHKAI